MYWVGLMLVMMVGDDSEAVLEKIDPQQNMWVTWANQTGQNSFCLSLASATDPFRTCLFGVPVRDAERLIKMTQGYMKSNCSNFTHKNVSEAASCIISNLNTSLPGDPQELDLLGSVAVGNSSERWTQTCFMIGDHRQGLNVFRNHDLTGWTNVSSTTQGFGYRNKGDYCGTNTSRNQGLGTLGAEASPKHKDKLIWNNDTAKALPSGIFLICGDRAWQGIPANVFGGPCYLGQLTLFAPDLYSLRNQSLSRRSKRALKTLGSDCDDGVELWGAARRVFASLVPAIGTAHALASINKLACWAVKQSTVTTQILTEMAQDRDSLRHAILKNRAATDFLLLAQGHGCEEIEGMCCFNLSDHGQSIHGQLKWLREHMGKITVQTSWFDNWLQSIFGGLSNWLVSLIKEGFRFLLIVILIIIAARVIFGCVTKKLEQVTEKALVVQNKNGGIVEEWLTEIGHVDIKQLRDL